MSHNITVKDVVISDITALQAAVSELQREGKKISLVKDGHYRGYNSSTSGKYPYVIKIEDSPYDIALTKDAQGNYVPVFDPWQGHIRRAVGAEAGAATLAGQSCDVSSNRACLGGLMQRYALCKAEIEASRQGLSSTRHYDSKTKQFQLEVAGY